MRRKKSPLLTTIKFKPCMHALSTLVYYSDNSHNACSLELHLQCQNVVDISTSIIEITSWLVSAYDFYSRVVKDR